MVIVRVGIEDHNGPRGQAGGDVFDVADAHAGVEEKGLLVADYQIGNRFLGLARLVNREGRGSHFVNLEPLLIREHALERFVLRPRQIFAPLRAVRASLRRQ